MCDYCDCRSHPEIASLSADHDRLLAVLRQLRDAGDAGDIAGLRSTTAVLQSILRHHAEREEEGVFTLLRDEVGAAYIEAFAVDHEVINSLVAAATEGDVRAGMQLADFLTRHIAREESDLFPAAHQLLSPVQWGTIDAPRASR